MLYGCIASIHTMNNLAGMTTEQSRSALHVAWKNCVDTSSNTQADYQDSCKQLEDADKLLDFVEVLHILLTTLHELCLCV